MGDYLLNVVNMEFLNCIYCKIAQTYLIIPRFISEAIYI